MSSELSALVAPLLASDVARIPFAVDAFLATPGAFDRLIEFDRELCATLGRWQREFAFRQLCVFADMDTQRAREILGKLKDAELNERVEVKRGCVASSLLRMVALAQVPSLDTERYAAFARVWVGRVEFIERNVST